jgi:hypothetical protein
VKMIVLAAPTLGPGTSPDGITVRPIYSMRPKNASGSIKVNNHSQSQQRNANIAERAQQG